MSKLLALLFLLPSFLTLSLSKSCPPCGTTFVPYPLSTSPSCNDPSYPIRCSSSTSTLFLDALNSSYPITSISPSTQRLVIQPAPFVPGTCTTTDLHSQGIQLNNSLPFNVTSSNTIMLLNCTTDLLRTPLNCSTNSLCHIYINATQEATKCGEIPICCSFRTGGSTTAHSIKVNETRCSAYRSFVNLNPSQGAGNWGSAEGLELQWESPKEPVCRSQGDCKDGSRATCTVDAAGGNGIKRCFCVDGFMWDPINGTCTNIITGCEAYGSCGSTNHIPLIAELEHEKTILENGV